MLRREDRMEIRCSALFVQIGFFNCYKGFWRTTDDKSSPNYILNDHEMVRPAMQLYCGKPQKN